MFRIVIQLLIRGSFHGMIIESFSFLSHNIERIMFTGRIELDEVGESKVRRLNQVQRSMLLNDVVQCFWVDGTAKKGEPLSR